MSKRRHDDGSSSSSSSSSSQPARASHNEDDDERDSKRRRACAPPSLSSCNNSVNSNSISIVTALHRHVTESVLVFLTMPELASVVTTCREWHQAARTMAGRNYCYKRGGAVAWPTVLCGRHVTKLLCPRFTPEVAHAIAVSLPRLETLLARITLSSGAQAMGVAAAAAAAVTIVESPPPTWGFADSIITVHLDIKMCMDGLVESLAALPHLSELILCLHSGEFPAIEALQQARALQRLEIGSTDIVPLASLTDDQVRHIRALGHLHFFFCSHLGYLFSLSEAVDAARVFAMPHQLMWRELGWGVLPASILAIPSSLPSLTSLNISGNIYLREGSPVPAVSDKFTLRGLPHLRNLIADRDNGDESLALVNLLHGATTITSWITDDSLDACEGGSLRDMLVELPNLTELLVDNVRSFDWIGLPSLQARLQVLTLGFDDGLRHETDLKLSVEDIRQIQELRALRELKIDPRLLIPSDAMDTQLAIFTPPSRAIPTLQSFQLLSPCFEPDVEMSDSEYELEAPIHADADAGADADADAEADADVGAGAGADGAGADDGDGDDGDDGDDGGDDGGADGDYDDVGDSDDGGGDEDGDEDGGDNGGDNSGDDDSRIAS